MDDVSCVVVVGPAVVDTVVVVMNSSKHDCDIILTTS